ncbi:hypothetical protein Acr_07g0014280 [Actinidia rufa]|uniref:Uncharacterized protein n=1 Tax=Actinidia rufa TaxID=165716 RepID=A0A7J0EXR5_9ERIC|nr:hypothetical protein Acr_07g0014280 [Actinidia rufa]
MLLDANYAPGKPRMKNEMNKKMIGHIRQCIGYEMFHHVWRNNERVPKKRPHKEVRRRGLKKEVMEVKKRGREEVKEEILADDGRGQNPERQRGVLYTCSMRGTCMNGEQHDEELLAKGTVRFRMADGRSIKVTGVRHVSLRCKIRSDEALKIRGAVVRHRPSGTSEKNGQRKQPLHRGTQSRRRDTRRMYLKDPEWYKSVRRCFEKSAEVWPDTRRCNQCRMSMEKLRGERQSRCTATGATSPK